MLVLPSVSQIIWTDKSWPNNQRQKGPRATVVAMKETTEKKHEREKTDVTNAPYYAIPRYPV